jgi:hypothetical protein
MTEDRVVKPGKVALFGYSRRRHRRGYGRGAKGLI